MGTYRVGQACLNGHPITGNAHSEFATAFCSTCGATAITQCPSCSAPLKGYYESPGIISLAGWSPSDHCDKCGKPLPWTQAKLDAVQELAEAIEELTDFEREQLAELMPHVIQETPRTGPAGFKISAIVARIKGPAKGALQDLLTNIAVEAGKKAMGF